MRLLLKKLYPYCALVFYLFVVGGCGPETEQADLPSVTEKGSVVLDVGGWDDAGFSFGNGQRTSGGGGDIAAYTSTSGVGIRVPEGRIFDFGPVDFDSVSTGIDRGSSVIIQIFEGHVYSIRFGDNFYAKILVTQARRTGFSKGVLAFDWVFQRNQTPSFVSALPTQTPVPTATPPALDEPSEPPAASPTPTSTSPETVTDTRTTSSGNGFEWTTLTISLVTAIAAIATAFLTLLLVRLGRS